MTARVIGAIAIVVGAVFALIGLETIGFGLLLIVPVGFVLRRHLTGRRFAVVVIAFAVGYLLGVGFFAVRTSGIVASGVVDWGVVSYFASMASIGVALLIAGLVLYLRNQDARGTVASGGTR